MRNSFDVSERDTPMTQSVLVCRAPHPRRLRGDSRFEGRLCGKRLQVVPFKVRPTYRAIHDWSEVHAGCIAVRCVARDCRAFTEYEIVSETEGDGGGSSSEKGEKGQETAASRGPRKRRLIKLGERPAKVGEGAQRIYEKVSDESLRQVAQRADTFGASMALMMLEPTSEPTPT